MNKELEETKPVNAIINTTIVFYEEPPKKDTWGSNNIEYKLCYNSKTGIVNIYEVGAFGDGTLIRRCRDRRNRGITLDEMLENIQEISNMTYKEFKEKILKGV